MSLDKIILPDFLIADMYKDTLVDSAVVSKTVPAKSNELGSQTNTNTQIKYLGNNKKRVAILINEVDATIIDDGDLAFLTNILKACKLFLDDIAIINLHLQQINYTAIHQQIKAEKVLMFGLEPTIINLPFTIPDFQVQDFSGVTYLLAPALSQMNADSSESKLLKTKLWVSLQKIF